MADSLPPIPPAPGLLEDGQHFKVDYRKVLACCDSQYRSRPLNTPPSHYHVDQALALAVAEIDRLKGLV